MLFRSTLLSRKQFLERLFRAQEMRPTAVPLSADAPARERFTRALSDIYFDSERWMKSFPPGDPALTRVVLATEPASATGNAAQGVQRLRELVLDPAYQLK